MLGLVVQHWNENRVHVVAQDGAEFRLYTRVLKEGDVIEWAWDSSGMIRVAQGKDADDIAKTWRKTRSMLNSILARRTRGQQ